MKNLLSAALLIFLLFSSSCKSDNPYNIPYVVVNFYVYPNTIDSDLGVSRFKYFSRVGYRGIMVYRMGSDQFLAYDRACTFDSENTTAIVAVDASGLVAVCPVCGSKYILTDGYPYQGPSKNPLVQYHTLYDGFKVFVSN
jgi:nitrite reductase/ring-hydroxylating ferredoxin subunit